MVLHILRFFASWRLLFAPLLAALNVFIFLPVLFGEWPLLEGCLGFIVALTCFLFDELIYALWFHKSFDVFLTNFMAWNVFKIIAAGVKILVIVFLTQLNATVFIGALLVAYFTFMFYYVCGLFMESINFEI